MVGKSCEGAEANVLARWYGSDDAFYNDRVGMGVEQFAFDPVLLGPLGLLQSFLEDLQHRLVVELHAIHELAAD